MVPAIPEEDLVDELVRLAEELGESPSTSEMDEIGRYSVSAYQSCFGSWNAAKKKAGLGTTPARPSYSDEELLAALRERADESGQAPTSQQMDSFEGSPNSGVYRTRFGSYNSAVIAAGLRTNTRGSAPEDHGHGKGQLIARLQQFRAELDENRPPTAREMDDRSKNDGSDWPCQATFRNRFGSWKAAVKAAGYEPYDQGRSPQQSIRDPDNVIPFGANWLAQRRKALARDQATCRDCGIDGRDHMRECGRDISVHHRQPRRWYHQDPSLSVEEDANRLANLLTLCSTCHPNRESWPVKPQIQGIPRPDVGN
jgi:hypothetical protein